MTASDLELAFDAPVPEQLLALGRAAFLDPSSADQQHRGNTAKNQAKCLLVVALPGVCQDQFTTVVCSPSLLLAGSLGAASLQRQADTRARAWLREAATAQLATYSTSLAEDLELLQR